MAARPRFGSRVYDGNALNNRRTRVLKSMVDELADVLIGRDAGHIAGFWARAWTDINFLGHKGVPVAGISALDGALWDAFGKATETPIYRLIGGAKDRVPAYHSGGLWLSSSVPELVEEAQRFVAQAPCCMDQLWVCWGRVEGRAA